MSHLLDEIRKTIRASGFSRYMIARESGVAESQLSRLMSGKRGLSIEAAEQLAAYLGLEIIVRPKSAKKGK